MGTINNQQLHEYLEIFHRIYLEKLKAVISAEYRNDLLRNHHLANSKIVGYISTFYGAGYKYCSGPPGEIEVTHGSARVEEFIFRLPRGLMDGPVGVAFLVKGPLCRVSSLGVQDAIPIKLDSPDASVTLADLRSRFKGRVTDIRFAEIFADRSEAFWSKEKAVERAMDEVLQVTIDVTGMERLRTSLDDYLKRFKQRHVLVLGDFSNTGMPRIEAIKAVLSSRGYYAFTLNDVAEVSEYNLRDKIRAVAQVCRFVVVDDSSRAGQTAEIPILEMLHVITTVLRLQGSDSTFVNRPLEATSKVMKEAEYEPQTLEGVLDESIRWAEVQIAALRKQYAEAYPWRSPQTG